MDLVQVLENLYGYSNDEDELKCFQNVKQEPFSDKLSQISANTFTVRKQCSISSSLSLTKQC